MRAEDSILTIVQAYNKVLQRFSKVNCWFQNGGSMWTTEFVDQQTRKMGDSNYELVGDKPKITGY